MNKQLLKKKCYKTILALAGAAIVAAMPVAAEATTLLGLTKTNPDIFSQEVNSQDGMHFYGEAISFTDGMFEYGITGGSFSLDTVLDTISITGTISDSFSSSTINPYTGNPYTVNPYTGILLSGEITGEGIGDFGFYDFSFTITGGSAASLFGGINGHGGTIISTLAGTADTFPAAPVPEPATMTLMLIGGSAIAAFRRRRSSSVV